MEKKNDFKPFIPADKVLPEFTVTSVIIGMILAVIFGGANAYLGLRVGMTYNSCYFYLGIRKRKWSECSIFRIYCIDRSLRWYFRSTFYGTSSYSPDCRRTWNTSLS